MTLNYEIGSSSIFYCIKLLHFNKSIISLFTLNASIAMATIDYVQTQQSKIFLIIIMHKFLLFLIFLKSIVECKYIEGEINTSDVN